MKTNSKILKCRDDVKSITYHRKPTAGEIKFGHGAIHYRNFERIDFIKKDGDIKKRIKAKDDGLIYTR